MPKVIGAGNESDVTRAYRLDASSAAIADILLAHQGPDLWAGGPVSPGEFAPVVIKSQKSGQRVIRPMVWGYPAPGPNGTGPAGEVIWVPTVRNLESPFWIGNLRHSELRCLVPATSFALRTDGKRRWFTSRDTSLLSMAGIWRDLTDMPVFAIIMSEANGAESPAGVTGAKSVPAVLDAKDHDRWLTADWKDARNLIASPIDRLRELS